MSQPSVNITERDGALGVLPAGQRLYAVAGVATSGPLNTPATFARTQDLIAMFTGGPGVEAACLYIDTYSKPVVFTRTGNTTAGDVSDVDTVGTGSSVVTVTGDPLDDMEVVLSFEHGGTRGTAGATYRISLDAGRTPGPVTALGTATSIAVAEAGITFELAAGNFIAGDTHSVVLKAPCFNASELDAALDALKNSAVDWELFHPAGPLDATLINSHIEVKFAALFAAGKYCYWMGSPRMPTVGETEAAYLTAMAGFSAVNTKYGALCGAAAKTGSGVSGRTYRRPTSFALAALQASVSEEVDTADDAVGQVPGVTIRDPNGNPDEHDESINPGLDDARFMTLRTWDGKGVYVNRPRLFSAPGSDFQIIPNRRVLNLAHIALRAYFRRRLNSPVLVNGTTGLILEKEALEIEAGAKAAMRALLLAKPKASAIDFVLSRTDNLLSTKTLTGQGFVIPLAYPEFIDLDVSLFNPVQVQVAA